jgi:hypothetical protein
VGRTRAPDQFGDQLGARLQSRRIAYERTRRLSLREWLLRGYQGAGEHLGDIVSVAGVFL